MLVPGTAIDARSCLSIANRALLNVCHKLCDSFTLAITSDLVDVCCNDIADNICSTASL